MKMPHLVLIIVAVAALAGGAYFLSATQEHPLANLETAAEEPSTPEAASAVDETTGLPPVTPAETTADAAVETDTQTAADAAPETAAVVDVAKAMAERGLGNPEAPIRLEEFASLTCSHCADFNKTTFEQLKTEYIDTGKVYFVYTDFPLNAPAIDASAVARCLPEERYFPFIKLLFETQGTWAFDSNPREALRQNAKLTGMSDETFNACVDSRELRMALIETMRSKGDQHQVQATPSFVVNGTQTIKGGAPIEEFRKIFDPLLAGQTETAPAEETTTEQGE